MLLCPFEVCSCIAITYSSATSDSAENTCETVINEEIERGLNSGNACYH
jgi:hypothetical protein